MPLIFRLGAVFIFSVFAVYETKCQAVTGSNVPDSSLWPIFSQLLSAQIGRTVQDINTLGLTDPTINMLWTSYSAKMSSMTKPSVSVQTTTEPTLPDLYQSSYSFNGNDNQASRLQINTETTYKSASTQATKEQNAQGTTSITDVLYKLLTPSLAGKPADTTNLHVLLNSLVGNAGNTVSKETSPVVDQQNTVKSGPGSTGSSASGVTFGYEKLLQQYDQVMRVQSSGTPSMSSTGSAPSSGYLQVEKTSKFSPKTDKTSSNDILYNQLTSEQYFKTTSSPATSSSPQNTFEQQLEIFFPQFKNLFPQSASINGTSGSSSLASGSVAGNTTQYIFDALLFGGAQSASKGASAATTESPQSSVLGAIQNMVNSPGGTAGLLSSHVQNVMKTRASRDMGCRFLPELLELDVLPTAPINCMNKCPFPYVNPKQFGVYCVCCPPGVDSHMIDMMSLYKGSSYMETPLAVIS